MTPEAPLPACTPTCETSPKSPTAPHSCRPQFSLCPAAPLFVHPPRPGSIPLTALNTSTNLHGLPLAWIERVPGKVWPRSTPCVIPRIWPTVC